MRLKRITAAAVATFAIACFAAGAALAQGSFPTKPITLIVPWNAGGSTDIYFRALGEVAGKELGQPIVVENRTGGTGTLGPVNMARAAKPDGYTLSQIPVTVMRLPLMSKRNWDSLTDFTYVIHLTGYTFGVTTKADSKFKAWKDVAEFAKANPGKVTYATTGPGGSLHIGMEQIAAKDGIKLTMVPFKGGAETNAAVLGGHVDLQADSTVWGPLVDSGQLRLLNVWTEKRNKRWPDAPTLKELGYPFVFDSPFGIAGPKGMPADVVEKLHQAFKKALADPKVKDIMEKYDFTERYMGPADYTKYVTEIVASEKAAVERLGLVKKE
ncbi:MAG: tripartite tricarboxylate transporter substrate binding protein [Hyphomicrobiaceae bacterium]|nr:tripartite tricarboxylate transporter substrate binding protein [Hyphomicrobiaceae bacterium]